ncbi:cytosine permease [Desulfobotulus sp. H1]|uniref:Cytosine permease n=1 Tax=Desulfobotulus pelophilus TaxID=2823377 RepID=A0ABT3N8B5_9BACT|nr:cytosine permease [Desulfobotulus pelophilus]MCW7753695.1 cytosine permease [Desulfobotulus pelophilus]
MENPMQKDNDFALAHVADSHRKGFWSMLVVMMGFTFFSASMWAGGKLGTGLGAWEFFLAVMTGNLLLGAYTALLAAIAARTGLSTHLLARYSFGEKGSFLPSFLLAVTQVGWFGVGVAMFALPVQKVTGWNLHLIILVSGMIMTFTAWFGMRALTVLSFVAVPAIAVLGFFSVGKAFTDFGGMEGWLGLVPAEPMTLFAAIGICVASFISGGTLTPDFTRFARSTKIAVITTLIAFFLGNSLMFLFGAVGAAFYQQADIADVLMQQGMIVWAMVILGLNIWTTNDNALYASGLGLSNITRWPKKILVLINGAVGTLMALYLYNNFVGWLSFLNTMLPAIGGVLIADYYMVRKASYERLEKSSFVTIRPVAVLAWTAGVLAARYIPGIAPLNSVVCAMAVYVAGTSMIAAFSPSTQPKSL